MNPILAELDMTTISDPLVVLCIVVLALVGLVRVMAKIVERRDKKMVDHVEDLVEVTRDLGNEVKRLVDKQESASDERRETRRELETLGGRINKLVRRMVTAEESLNIVVDDSDELSKRMKTVTPAQAVVLDNLKQKKLQSIK